MDPRRARNFPADATICIPSATPEKICHFCTELIVRKKEELDTLASCTEIRAVGGLQIVDYIDDISFLKSAFRAIVLTVQKSLKVNT